MKARSIKSKAKYGIKTIHDIKPNRYKAEKTMSITTQAQIDVCLNCESEECNKGYCEKIRTAN